MAILYYEKGLDKEQMQSDYYESYIALTNLGMCYHELKDYQTALKNFDRALKIDPKYINAFYWKLKTYNTLGKFDEVIKNCDEHTEFQNDSNLDIVEDVLKIKRNT